MRGVYAECMNIIYFSPYHLCMLHVTLILDLVTHCCVCLVFVDGMGGGKDGWVGLRFFIFWVWCGDIFLSKHF